MIFIWFIAKCIFSSTLHWNHYLFIYYLKVFYVISRLYISFPSKMLLLLVSFLDISENYSCYFINMYDYVWCFVWCSFDFRYCLVRVFYFLSYLMSIINFFIFMYFTIIFRKPACFLEYVYVNICIVRYFLL